jgi:hypothetical protein
MIRTAVRGRRAARALGAGVLALLAAACQVQTVVTVDVDQDGSGTVEVAVGLDEEALAEVPDLDDSGSGDAPDLAQLVRVDDLTASGWAVSEPSTGSDGFTWVRATKPFGTPEQGERVLAELTGESGILRDLQVTRSSSFGSDRYRFTGTADLGGGLEAFGDQGLATALDGEPLGEDVAVMEERLGRPLAEMLSLELDVRLPGAEATSWTPELGGDPVEMSTASTLYHWPVLALSAIAVLCLVALAAVLVRRSLRRA